MAKTDRRVTIGLHNRTRSEFEAEWAHNRPHAHRPPHCRVGDKVLYRANDWGPLMEATVVDATAGWDDGSPDLNACWPDPWPLVRLLIVEPVHASKVDPETSKPYPGSAPGRMYYVLTYEARLEGSAGWLPLDHERWLRPRAYQHVGA